MPSGETLAWQEFELTFHYFPGQTFYHGALLARRQSERPIFFIGDAFAPSGIDDYCLLNRNLVHKEGGFRLCFQKLRQFEEPFWLVNEHIPFVFEFSDAELDYLEQRYEQRLKILKELFPWDAPNYGVDEQWAVFYPYGAQTKPGQTLDLEVRITNHSPVPRNFHIQPRVPDGIRLIRCDPEITLEPGKSGAARMTVEVNADAGNYVITSDVSSNGMRFGDWIESLLKVE